MKYFVLKPRAKTNDDPHANASRIAMRAYAKAIKPHHPDFAQEICDWVDAEILRNTGIFSD